MTASRRRPKLSMAVRGNRKIKFDELVVPKRVPGIVRSPKRKLIVRRIAKGRKK